jgi:hypothetical protein
MSPESIHKLADRLGIPWDGDKSFMSWCAFLVGKSHLDDMNDGQLLTIYANLKNGKYPPIFYDEIKNSDSISTMMKKEYGFEKPPSNAKV